MRIKHFAATALISIAGLGAATGTAHAGPQTAEVAVRGAEHGVGYVVAPNETGTAVVATLDSGSFRGTPGRGAGGRAGGGGGSKDPAASGSGSRKICR